MKQKVELTEEQQRRLTILSIEYSCMTLALARALMMAGEAERVMWQFARSCIGPDAVAPVIRHPDQAGDEASISIEVPA